MHFAPSRDTITLKRIFAAAAFETEDPFGKYIRLPAWILVIFWLVGGAIVIVTTRKPKMPNKPRASDADEDV